MINSYEDLLLSVRSLFDDNELQNEQYTLMEEGTIQKALLQYKR